MEKYIKLHRIQPFSRELQALAQAVKAKRKGAYEQALKVVDQRLDGGARRGQEVHDAGAELHGPHRPSRCCGWRQSEYEASMEDGKFVKPVEYQDSRGFVWQAERMIEGAAAELARIDSRSLAKIRAVFAKLKTAWPAPMPPAKPVLDVGQISALISDIELHISRY